MCALIRRQPRPGDNRVNADLLDPGEVAGRTLANRQASGWI